ncbi:hypothetical protein D7V93_31995 [Corallococcus llansteffanensis]|uniref:Uncharacterized protein n=1 Tax=Corallococcus llansteffanensis TaxID=2316731 RepID=A0A3A8P0P2_9BACT|nr:hypothetical protein D7V93_31995 [Corallococcus llansteffanensis]
MARPRQRLGAGRAVGGGAPGAWGLAGPGDSGGHRPRCPGHRAPGEGGAGGGPGGRHRRVPVGGG